MVKSVVNALVENNVNGFKSIKLIHAKWQLPIVKRILINSLFTNQTVDLFKCSDSRCQCCQQILLEKFLYIKKFLLKTKMTCDSRNFICIVICPIYQEQYIGKTRIQNSEIVSEFTSNIFGSLIMKNAR